MKNKNIIKIQIIRDDNIDAFGAYAEGADIILLNVEAHLICSIEEKVDFKEIVLETLMHEFGHCIEEKLKLEFSEDRIERIVESYRNKYGKI